MDISNATSKIGISINNTGYIQPRGNIAAYFFGLLIAVLGLCGNGFVLLVCLISKDLRSLSRKTSMKTVLNLALTDLLTMACVFCTNCFLILNVKMSYYVCLFTVSFPIYMTFVTQIVLLVTTLERYISICHQQRFAKFITNRSLNGLLVSAWLLPLPLSLLPFFGFNNWNEFKPCVPFYLFHKWIFTVQSVFFILAIILTVALYIPIILKAREFHLKTRPAQFIGINARTTRLKAKRQALISGVFMGIITLVFMICNLPFSIVKLGHGVGLAVDPSTVKATFLLGILKCVVNPFLYAFQKESFYQKAANFLRCRCCNSHPANQSELRGNRLHIPLPVMAPLPSRPLNRSRNPAQCGEWDRELSGGSVHANTSSTNICQTYLSKTIHVKPYQETQTSETSL